VCEGPPERALKQLPGRSNGAAFSLRQPAGKWAAKVRSLADRTLFVWAQRPNKIARVLVTRCLRGWFTWANYDKVDGGSSALAWDVFISRNFRILNTHLSGHYRDSRRRPGTLAFCR
jgi:hypothetical protein